LAFGADLLDAPGLACGCHPHYDNAEGGNHDTRFCYLGERRLRVLRGRAAGRGLHPGVHGHTALVMDLDTGWRRSWAWARSPSEKTVGSTVFPAGRDVIADLVAAASAAGGDTVAIQPPVAASSASCRGFVLAPLREEVATSSASSRPRWTSATRRRRCGRSRAGETIQAWSPRHGPVGRAAHGRSALPGGHRLPGEMAVAARGIQRKPWARFVDRAPGRAPARPRGPRLGRRRANPRPAADRRRRDPRHARRHLRGGCHPAQPVS